LPGTSLMPDLFSRDPMELAIPYVTYTRKHIKRHKISTLHTLLQGPRPAQPFPRRT
jgi:hypothetical protein